ncbi:MAG TPA: carboxymuconolactone decarboxylase family protein [Anaeromyxobacteraceae bacterium]|nr:carboxymuconolactone decarboxylase family protein [Anaeromyxobacteraceae bacterium]
MTSEIEKHPCGPGREPEDQPILQGLLPIAVVIAAGCESCAEGMVRHALKEGSSRRQVLKAIGIVEHLHGLECFKAAVSEDIRERMVKPLARARKTVEEEPSEATEGAGRCCW